MGSTSLRPGLYQAPLAATACIATAPADPRPLALVNTFDAYYRADYRKLVGLAYVLTGSHSAAEDLAQDALTEAHRKWAQISQYDDPAGWVRRVMINKSTSRVRRLRTEAKGLVRIAGRRTEPIAPAEPTLEVWQAVRDLPARQSQVVALFYWEDRSQAEIAEILGVSQETVKTHLKRGRATLAVQLEAFREETP